jgi:hypothetical protein
VTMDFRRTIQKVLCSSPPLPGNRDQPWFGKCRIKPTLAAVLGFDSYFHRSAWECPAVSYERGCQGTPFLWFLCTFHLWLL